MEEEYLVQIKMLVKLKIWKKIKIDVKNSCIFYKISISLVNFHKNFPEDGFEKVHHYR